MIDHPQILTGIAAVPIIVALVAATGAAFGVPRRFLPILAVGHGIAWNVAAAATFGEPLSPAALGGVVVGLAASGLYSAAVKPLVRASVAS
jgi:predicted RND superfamily exporter protein